MKLSDSQIGKEYIITGVNTRDEDLDSFLFTLGCYPGEPIVVVSRRRSGSVVSLKEARYSIDSRLAAVIEVE
jgi:ferrous iron transport protein A